MDLRILVLVTRVVGRHTKGYWMDVLVILRVAADHRPEALVLGHWACISRNYGPRLSEKISTRDGRSLLVPDRWYSSVYQKAPTIVTGASRMRFIHALVSCESGLSPAYYATALLVFQRGSSKKICRHWNPLKSTSCPKGNRRRVAWTGSENPMRLISASKRDCLSQIL
ncbi:hypothetical protein M438DRAFT_19008 [Aureobasidium pullulans EXF-150]|uniref:Uncharacterized protein n=1 Tax=Aureobasidium pullulans EXF-150 TaxID=1043002 RepID=A0A074YT89_AURPU|nr:uncharacterized protein M438DRAFT_19008 [Aureobasidium pullulans EXF-150]KEQ90051.1 hypothetical protein M438DRAFT_19008 [Aureobasidium pullulans EXF-150]